MAAIATRYCPDGHSTVRLRRTSADIPRGCCGRSISALRHLCAFGYECARQVVIAQSGRLVQLQPVSGCAAIGRQVTDTAGLREDLAAGSLSPSSCANAVVEESPTIMAIARRRGVRVARTPAPKRHCRVGSICLSPVFGLSRGSMTQGEG